MPEIPTGAVSQAVRELTLSLLVVVAGCGREIDEPASIPAHRIEPCKSWCAMMFDPVCPAQEVEVKTERECNEVCVAEDGIWAPVDGEDDCSATYIPYVDCLKALSCEEIQQHFALRNVVPTEEQSSCGTLERSQLVCQAEHY